ncbi:hypothetical protein BDF14DRAFT_547933 [Spinellus fusiger]|nr:hypothetical protein BDF14DRAFT_547933 [Spinellus fusiger]
MDSFFNYIDTEDQLRPNEVYMLLDTGEFQSSSAFIVHSTLLFALIEINYSWDAVLHAPAQTHALLQEVAPVCVCVCKPFKRSHLTWTADTLITSSQLARQKEAFWETAPSYEGRLEIWQALRAAINTPDIHLARSILEAANIMLPTGNPADGCFDELGHCYVIPLYCLVDPLNLVSEETPANEDESDTSHRIVPVPTIVQIPLGKTKEKETHSLSTNASHPITIRLSTAKDLTLHIHQRNETIGSLKVRIFQHPEAHIHQETHTLRLIYLGRILQDTMSITCEEAETSQIHLEHTFKKPHTVFVGKSGVLQALVAKRE